MISLKVAFRKKPYSVLTYEALFRRLNPIYRNNDFINQGFLTENAGYWGERNVDYKLSLYPLEHSHIIQGLRLKNGPHYFQIDTLILTKSCFYILEVKNIKGELEYDTDFQQLTQKVGTEVKGIRNPIYQAEAQKRNLETYLHNMKIFDMPIDCLVVVSDPKTVLKCKQQNQEVFDKMIHAESLPIHLDKMILQYGKEILNTATLKKVYNYFLKNQTPHQPELLKKHKLGEKHLIRGIPCSSCQHYPMVRDQHKWTCTKCLSTSKDAHRQPILDHFLLHKNTITNKECRKILNISSEKVAYRILKSMNLEQTGEKKGRKYLAPRLEDFPQDSVFQQGNHGNYAGPQM